MMGDYHEHFMKKCLSLALRGYGKVHPNPMVGAVIVKNGMIVARGYHRRYGGDHAEVEALKKAGEKAREATLYVTLEPCNHHGKTPPCTTAIEQAGIRKVIYAVDDPNPVVTGNGKKRLQKAGIDVESGILETEAVQLNEYFFFAMRSKLPFVILKAATTLDGYIADSRSRSKWITGEAARGYVQHLRNGVDAVLVGANTVRKDNPRLTVHAKTERQPYRIILDGTLITSASANVYNDQFRQQTIVVCAKTKRNRVKIKQLEQKGVTVLAYKSTKSILPLRRIMRDLWKRKITSILVEGGESVFRQFIENKLYAKGLFFIAPKIIGGGIPVVSGINRSLRNAYNLNDVKSKMYGDDVLIEGYSELYGKYI